MTQRVKVYSDPQKKKILGRARYLGWVPGSTTSL